MVKKITISVPDELHEKMMKWRESFNFSQVFQRAISDLIQKKEDFKSRLKEDSNMEVIIERLKKEKEKSEHEWFEIGMTEGVEWAKGSHYDEIQMVVHAEDEIPMQRLIEFDPSNEDWFQENIEEGYHITENYFNSLKTFEAGFVEGVKKFWDEIKDKI